MRSRAAPVAFAALLGIGAIGFATAACRPDLQETVVNDVTNLNPIRVARVVTPRTIDEIRQVVLADPHSPISIGGGRFSQGGQTATEGAIQLDMRQFNQVLALDVAARQVTVQPGIRWRELQEAIDPHDLSVKIMQTYANFTVGGALSVNAHGRYVGEGPIIRSVRSIKLVLADGSVVRASRTEKPELFRAAIGGYGGIGVIVEATLDLVPNSRIRREVRDVALSDYPDFFAREIRGNRQAVFHNADLVAPEFDRTQSVSWYQTDAPLTDSERLTPVNRSYWLEPNVISLISTLPFGQLIRRRLIEPFLYGQNPVIWRNREASYDVAQLEPKTPRLLFTYVLQEYFVPVARLTDFVPKMREVFRRHDVNVLNVSIRNAQPDTESYLSWAPEEVFSLVVYYKQWTTEGAKRRVGVWTRELIDEVLRVGGRYYLPYQIHATEAQVATAYPGLAQFSAVRHQVDPNNRFRNKLWDRYYRSGRPGQSTVLSQ